jgi:lipopolysaccharide/colanic/teichoic acid biosynthesis glycosyltransferase
MSPGLEVQVVQSGSDMAEVRSPRVIRAPVIWSPQPAILPRPWVIADPEVVRRAANVVAAAILFVLVLPVMLLVALMVRLSSPGPVIYVQTRVGLDRRQRNSTSSGSERRRFDYGGRLFRIYKFRTMTWEAESNLQIWAKRGDPRVTRLGGFLRKYRLDELPQLINVLKGEMNLVGPRPEQPRLFAELRTQIYGYEERQRVLPGITGWAQINHGYDSTVEDVRKKLEYDLQYIDKASAGGDMAILLRTIPVMLFQKGAV